MKGAETLRAPPALPPPRTEPAPERAHGDRDNKHPGGRGAGAINTLVATGSV